MRCAAAKFGAAHRRQDGRRHIHVTLRDCGGHVKDLGRIASDAGLIYCLGVSPGSVIRNNIFAPSANHALWPYSEKRPSTFRRNIVYLTQGELLIPLGQRSLDERLAAKEPLGAWDENVYWHAGGAEKLRFYRRSFAEWQSLGLGFSSTALADTSFYLDNVRIERRP